MDSSNRLPLEQRINLGKSAERVILDWANEHCPIDIGTKGITHFEPASDDEDMHGKIDAWAYNVHGEKFSVQIKNRESGLDLGIATMMPYVGDAWFCANYKASEGGDLNWDRDMRSTPDYYLIANEGQICLAHGEKVRSGVMAILSNLYTSGGFRGSNTHKYPALDGLTLKLVKDIGAGYSTGKYKVICYINLESLANRGAFLEHR